MSERTHRRVDDWAFRREGPRLLHCDISYLCPGDEIFGDYDLLGLSKPFVIRVNGPLLLILSGLEIALGLGLCFVALLPDSVVGLSPLADLSLVRWGGGRVQVEVINDVRDVRGYGGHIVLTLFLDPCVYEWFLVL